MTTPTLKLVPPVLRPPVAAANTTTPATSTSAEPAAAMPIAPELAGTKATLEAERARFTSLQRNLYPGGNLHALAVEVCRRFAVGVADVLSRMRTVAVVDARRELAWRLRQKGFSYPEIGLMLDRDSTSVISLVKDRQAQGCERVTKPRQLELFPPPGDEVQK